MEKAIEILVAVNCFIMGVSHLFKAKVWVEFFKLLRGYGMAGAFANGFISLCFGSIIVSFHWAWDGIIPILVTSLGIAQIIKSLIAFVAPEVGLRSIHSKRAEDPMSYRMGGVIFIIFSIAVMVHLMRNSSLMGAE